ncbi:MAG: alpha-2-macroglobulin [Pirellulaceae bacterium]|nr:alpha-2-macroglobulin [Pirellulaceae bacterium]
MMPQLVAEDGDKDNDPLWNAVLEALAQGQPKTAIERLAPIAARAQATGDVAEKIVVLATRVNLESTTNESAPDTRLKRLRAEIDSAEAAMRPMLELIQATWMWEFFQENRGRFAGRTGVADSHSPQADDADAAAVPGPDDDLTTWDLPRILKAVDGQFARALREAEQLKQTPVEQYKLLLTKGSVPAKYRPSMYDAVVHHALEFYSAAEQAGSRSIHAFDLLVDSPVFAPLEEFLAWQPEAVDRRAPLLVAVKLHQELLKFHSADEDLTAQLEADFARLQFANNHAQGGDKAARYDAALRHFQIAASDHPLWAQAQAKRAQLAQDAGQSAAAHQLASEALDRFPTTVGGNQCYNLIQEIEAREAQVTTERVWNDPWPTIDVRYRNVTKVYFRMLPLNFQEFVTSHRWQPENLNDDDYRRLLNAKPIKAWSADLPATADYKLHVHSLPVPKDMPLGAYYLLSSHNEDFSDADNQVCVTEVWVSKLSLVVQNKQDDGKIGGYVLEAGSGLPIAGATIQAWQHEPRNGKRIALTPIKTDRDGRFEFPVDERGPVWLWAEHGRDRLSSTNMHSNFGRQHGSPLVQQTVFFTDRAIYRPGQTIRFKGICYSFQHENDKYETLSGQDMTVALLDANHQPVEQLQLRSNDYGSFSGSFTAPRDRLTGMMTIQVVSGSPGQAAVRVEEYKRPKFEVELSPPTAAPKLNQQVTVAGKATAYTGASTLGASVQWRVVRQVRYPGWWYWRMWWLPPSRGESQEIARGSAVTDDNGEFQLQFVAKPDASVAEDSQATFQYVVHADVTDGTGETRSTERTVNVGFIALSANLSVDDWQTTAGPVELTIKTTDLDGQNQVAAGRIKIHALQQPDQVARPSLMPPWRGHTGRRGPVPVGSDERPKEDLSNPASWPLGDVAFEADFQTDATGLQKLSTELGAGMYRAILTTQDRFGKPVTAELPLEVLDVNAPRYAARIPHRLSIEKSSVQPGQTLRAVWGSGYQSARALIEIEHRGKMIRSYWTDANRTQSIIELPITEAMRGGVTLHVTFVKQNRAYLETRKIDVPWSNKQLKITWERFVSKLGPAQRETWTAVIQGPDAEKAVAEMVATLYDASLDAFAPHAWMSGFGVFRQDYSHLVREFANHAKLLQTFRYDWNIAYKDIDWRYSVLDIPGSSAGPGGGRLDRTMPMLGHGGISMRAMSAAPEAMADSSQAGIIMQKSGGVASSDANSQAYGEEQAAAGTGGDLPKVSLDGISVRTNLNETAFFFPHIVSAGDGVVRLEFTMPEALTRWRFLGFAHDQQLRGGLLSDSAVTSKDLMIQPNAPRFLREGDEVEVTVKVTNMSPTRQTGSAGLNFNDPQTGNSLDAQLGNATASQEFDIPAGGTQALAWRIRVPDGLSLITYRALASSGRLSDGEEGYLPVLSRRVLITESLPLPIRGAQTKQFQFRRLLDSGNSNTLQHQSLTVQMASNPAWYAVMSLPYLMTYPHQCSEQIFNRLYANSLAGHIAASDPKIERVFEQWRRSDALDSPLTKNQDLKSTMLEESPWVQQAQSESQSRRNVGVLFDRNRLSDETQRALTELADRQLADGRWAWFPDGPPSDYITLYITTGFGRLRHLGVAIDSTAAIRSLTALDNWLDQQHRLALDAMQRKKDTPNPPAGAKAVDQPGNFLNYTIAMYLYGRSFFLPEHPIAAEHQVALRFWLDQAERYWLQIGSLQSQAHVALALKRFGKGDAAQKIMVSLKERSLTNEELGTYWKTADQFYWWYHAPIESQAALIEAFDEVAQDAKMVEDCKVWLLKQKQTQHWKTTKATADAVYALLLRGTDLLVADQPVEVALNDQLIQPVKIEAGTGFYEQRRVGGDVNAQLGNISVTKREPGVAWGSVHWQYFEDIDRVTAHADTPLKLTKELYVKRNTDSGPQLQAVGQNDRVANAFVGDELVVRLVLKVDRDMEYVHLKDHRGSGTEPVNVLSGYQYQDGLGYYESTRDTASHFFIDYLRSGTYVFEYSTRVQLKGSYSTGMANVQCMYAPEFNSHSQSIRLEVQ